MENFDYVIVGAGSSGCVLANRLSTDRGVSVVLIEAGPGDTPLLMRMPRGIGKMHHPGNPHVKFYEASKGGNRPHEMWLKGSTLGGSSSVNGMVYVRGAPLDYDRWENDYGCTGWGWSEIGRCFTELEDHELGADREAVRGTGGGLKVSVHGVRNRLSEAVIEAGAQFGLTPTSDVNSPRAVRDGGIGYLSQTTFKGERMSAARAFIEPIKSRPNLTIATNTSVRRIVIEDGKATGVLVRDPSGERTIGAKREVIVCSGAIESPKLLQLSGIGPRAVLDAFKIPVVVDSPGVGQNLREHLTLPMKFQVTQGSYNAALRGFGLINSAANYFVFKKGALTHTAHEIVGFMKSDPSMEHADVQIGVGLFTMKKTDKGYGIDDQPGITLFCYFTRPQSQGEIRITSADPDAAPFINANYLDAEIDRQSNVRMVRRLRELMNEPAVRPYIVRETAPGAEFQNDDEILEWLVQGASTAFHVAGTCRMGSDEQAPLDPQLRVRGVSGLRVCDTSIFPDLVSGNTNGPAMAVGLRLAKMMA